MADYMSRKKHLTKTQQFWKVWSQFKGAQYTGDKFADGLDDTQLERFRRNYQGVPEKFYSRTKLPVITPKNALQFLKHLKDNGITSVDMQEHFSGSSTLSYWAYR
eukprot:4768719-Pyramimonas_sp.AAC.1